MSNEQPQVMTGNVMLAFQAALTEVKDLIKTETADTGRYTYSYVPLTAVLDECKRVCALHKLSLTQSITHDGELFAVITQLIHADGSSLGFPAICLPMPREAQALGSAATYLRRYSLMAIFGMGTEDDDGRAATVAASTQPGRRTEAERMIREQIATMDDTVRKQFTGDFKEQFGVGLSDLAASKHGEALAWAKAWTPSELPAADTAADRDAHPDLNPDGTPYGP